MQDLHFGVDVNGLADRTAALDWASGSAASTVHIGHPVVIEPVDDRKPMVAGEAAVLHPVGRGWQQPRWIYQDARRRSVADLLASIKASCERDVSRILGAHLRYMAGRADRVALAAPDDFSTEAQTQLIDAVRSAARYDPHDGWRPLTAVLLWRSISAVFGWARTLSAQEIMALKGREVFVVSLLADRMLVSSLSLDIETKCNDAGPLVTPVRSKAGRSYADPYSPLDVESHLVEAAADPELKRQLSAIDAGYDYCIGRVPDSLLQGRGGRWIPVPAAPRVSAECRNKAIAVLHRQLTEAGIREEVDNPVVIVETPDPERGFEDISWQQIAVACIRQSLKLPESEVVGLGPETVAVGCAEYSARLAHELPTFFDYLPQIEIAALEATDRESFAFIPLLKAERVPGNQLFRQRLDGRFEVQAGNDRIIFHLWKGDERFVRKSIVQLPFAPEKANPVSLVVEQRPVSGYAVIDVVPSQPGALGPTRISLDWRRMEDTGKTTEQIRAELGTAILRAYPSCAPAYTHASVWKALELGTTIEQFLNIAASVHSKSYRDNLHELRLKLGRRVNPRFHGVLGGVNESLRPFSSDGKPPEGSVGAGLSSVADLATALRVKIDRDLADLSGHPQATNLRDDLLIAGSWMFSGAPEAVKGFFRRVAADQQGVGKKIEALSRVLCQVEHIESAFNIILRRLSVRRTGYPPWAGAMNDLKSIALLLEYEEGACRILTTAQAELVLECALGTLDLELSAKKGNSGLKYRFLWAVKAILLILRHRRANPNFICPPRSGDVGSAFYERTLSMLRAAEDQAKRPIRRASQIARDAVENAIQFVQMTGGNPDIIRAISNTLEDCDDGN